MLNSNIVAAQEINVSEKVIFTTIEMSDTYSKVKIEYLETGEIEYLESILENGKFVHYVVSSEGEEKHKIEANGNDIYVDGESLGGISKITLDSASTENELSILADNTKWEYLNTTEGNSSWKFAQAGLIASVIASLLGLPAGAAIVLTITTTFVSLDLTTTYYKKSHYVDSNANFSTCRRATNTSFYKYSNYTGLIEVSGLIVDHFDPCAGGY